MSRFRLWKSAWMGSAGKIRDRLTRAAQFGECDSFSESKKLLSSTFYVSGAAEGLTREMIGSDRVDALIALENQYRATVNPSLLGLADEARYLGRNGTQEQRAHFSAKSFVHNQIMSGRLRVGPTGVDG